VAVVSFKVCLLNKIVWLVALRQPKALSSVILKALLLWIHLQTRLPNSEKSVYSLWLIKKGCIVSFRAEL